MQENSYIIKTTYAQQMKTDIHAHTQFELKQFLKNMDIDDKISTNFRRGIAMLKKGF
jgi:hypothetical protein